MSAEAWGAIVAAIIAFVMMIFTGLGCICTFWFWGGKIVSQMETLNENFKDHEKKDAAQFAEGNERMNGHALNLSAVNERLGMDNTFGTHAAMGLRVQSQ